MSRYTILILLNTPIVLAGIINALVAYKMKKISRRKFLLRSGFWVSVFLGIFFTEDIYIYLFSNDLTDTEPLSLFDVIQITGLTLSFFIANQAHMKAERLEKRLQDLHQELSIRMKH